jgi:VIT1/CCC1 family predicted Fe2+/Mn2+ transporter
LRLTSFFSTIIACLLPVIAISVLSQVHGTRNLLLCLAGFSLVFALGLIAMTQGTSKRTEVFAATAA